MKTVLITGTSSGFGMLSVIALAKENYRVIATMRDLHKKDKMIERAQKERVAEKIECLQMDITNAEEVMQALNYVDHKYGKIDILVNNAGFAQGGFFEEITDEMWQAQFQTNLFGHIRVTRNFLPLLRKSGGGKIINISSISGIFGFPGLSPYTSSKFALEGWSESLRLELRGENIWVSLVEPASYKTGIWNKGLKLLEIEKERPAFQRKLIEQAILSGKNGSDPSEVVQLIVKICNTENPKLRYPIGGSTKWMSLIKTLIPWRMIEFVVNKKIMKK